jgi:hypothetical protein
MSPKALSIHILVSLACSISFAASDSKVRQSLDEVVLAKDQANIAFREASTNEQKERLRYITQRLTSAESLLQESLGGSGNYPSPPPPPPPSSGAVELYRSDSCTGTLLGTASAGTRCEKFAGAGDAWGVKINGECLNIVDASAVSACEAFKGGAERTAAQIFNSDSCSGNAVAAVGSLSQCDKLSTTGTTAWGVKIDGKCSNIADTSPAKACEAFKGASTAGAVAIYNSDSCSGGPQAYIDYNSRCENLKGLPAAWGIMVNGRCENISDLPIEVACERYRP